MNVKQERHDEAEIEALADKIREGNKSRLIIQAQKTPTAPITLNSIINDKKKLNHLALDPKPSVVPIDDDSIRGRFGWETVGKSFIPYINRAGERYCAVKMVEMKALNKYLNYLHQDIYNCTCIRSYYITEAESRLLNEINIKHSEYHFGREPYTQRELIVRLSDALEFYSFLSSCYTKLISGDTDPAARSGFIRINKESVVPYTVYNTEKFVPLFYFEGETENLKQRANKLEGWDLSYLKFCCKVQGIRNELFANDSCSVISLNDIKNYFPPGTLFEDYWPTKSVDSQLLVSASTRNQSQIIQWTRQPSAPPMPAAVVSPKAVAMPKQAPIGQPHNQMHNSIYNYGNSGGHNAYANPTNSHGGVGNAAVRGAYPTAAPDRFIRSSPRYSDMTQGPPPLVPSTKTTTPAPSNFHYTTSQANLTNYMLANEQINNQMNYHQENNDDLPPPMIPIRQILANGGALSSNFIRNQQQVQRMQMEANQNNPQRSLQNNYSVNNRQPMLINQQPAHQQSSRPVPVTFPEDHNSIANGQLCLDNLSCKLIPIPEPPTGSTHIPYKMQKALVEGKLLPCINMKPYVYSDLLVTLPDLVINFFNKISVQTCQQVMKVLNIDLYKANNAQTHVLMEGGKCQSPNEVVPLVQVRNVIDYMPQLKYMLGGVMPSMANKRQRNS